jgi:bifunctional non-homologous end joining protein LigD
LRCQSVDAHSTSGPAKPTFASMPISRFMPCIPTRRVRVPAGPDWVHEIKHDGYRLIVQRDGDRVRLFTRCGHDWSGRYPLITAEALRLRETAFVIDGEAVVLGDNAVADFAALHLGRSDKHVRLIAFDLLALNGDDIRREPLLVRKAKLKKLLEKSNNDIQFNPHMQGDIGSAMFQFACELGLEGVVSKHRDSVYRAGHSTNWIKVKNPASPAMTRAQDIDWSRK